MATLGRIRIPRIGLDQPLYEGIAQYVIDAGPAHWPGTALPGQPGNMVIAGHRTTHTHPFYAVADLQAGDSIIIDTNDGRRFTYRVDQEFVVPSNALWIKDPLAGRRLTIFTCHPIGSSRQRLVVRATLAG
jgi:sortase A